MCGGCGAMPAPSWWPPSVVPPPGQFPSWWPPGYHLRAYGSCGPKGKECKLGCMFSFRPSLQPTPPPPAPPPPKPRPSPAVTTGSVNFSWTLGSHMVLQRAPNRAAVYGFVGLNATKSGGYSHSKVKVVLRDENGVTTSVPATIDAHEGKWKALLPPRPAGGTYTVTVTCIDGCTGSATIDDVTFGDVWYCSGQSNMALPFRFTYARNASIRSCLLTTITAHLAPKYICCVCIA